MDRTVTSDLLEHLTSEFLHIFDRCPARLKKKIMSISNTQGEYVENYLNCNFGNEFNLVFQQVPILHNKQALHILIPEYKVLHLYVSIFIFYITEVFCIDFFIFFFLRIRSLRKS